MKSLKFFELLLFLIIIIGISFIGIFQPMMADDFYWASNVGRLNVLEAIIDYYNTVSGRIQYVLFNQLIWKYDGFLIFIKSIQGVLVLLLSYITLSIAINRKPRIFKSDKLLFVLSFCLIWFGVPFIGEVSFWISGFTTYMIPLIFALIFILVILKSTETYKTKYNKLYPYLFFLYGVWTGIGHELINFQLLLLLLLLTITKWEYIKKNRLAYFGITGFLTGFLILYLASGNYNRMSLGNEIVFTERLYLLFGYIIYTYFANSYAFIWPFIILVLIIGYYSNNFKMNNLLNNNFIFLISGILGLFPFFFLPSFYVDRAAFFSIIFFNIFLLSLIKDVKIGDKLIYRFKKRIFKLNLYYIYLVILLIISIGVTRSLNSAFGIYKEILENEKFIELQKDNNHFNVKLNPLKTKFNRATYISYISVDKNYWVNKFVAGYYGINSIELSKEGNSYNDVKTTFLGKLLKEEYKNNY